MNEWTVRITGEEELNLFEKVLENNGYELESRNQKGWMNRSDAMWSYQPEIIYESDQHRAIIEYVEA